MVIKILLFMLLQKDKSEDILDGFEAHADDYITKPFNIQELLARVKSVIKDLQMILKF